MSISVNRFLTEENLQLLWEVVASEDIVKQGSAEMLEKIGLMFNENVGAFYEKEKTRHSNLIQINKHFINLIILHIKRILPTLSNNINNNPERKELITHSDIEAKRLSDFEQNYNLKQTEFMNAMALPVPPTPNFSDKKDTPISELEVEMKRAIAKRNYDIERINSQLLKTTISQNQPIQNNYNEPFQAKKNHLHPPSNIKYIKIDNTDIEFDHKNEIIDLNIQENKKHVHWAREQVEPESFYTNNRPNTNNSNIITTDTSINTNDNIFSKLKLIEPKPTIEIQTLQEEVNKLRTFVEEQMIDIKNQLHEITKQIQKNEINYT